LGLGVRKGQRPPWIVPGELWARIEPLLPVVPRRADHPGRRRLDDRKVLCGILFVLYTGIPWEFLPQEPGFGSGMTCWRRLPDWHQAGVWQRLHEVLLAELNAARGAGLVQGGDRQLARARAEGRPKTGPSPVDRAKPGSKHHLITEAHGIPLAVSLTGGQRNDVTQLMPLVQAFPPVRGRRGRPRQRPDRIYADRGYDHDKYRRQVRAKGITPVIARRGTGHGSGLGVYRRVVEQSIALLHWFRRLRIRWEIRDDIHEAFLSLASAIICWRRLQNLSLC
jgi:transposase